MYLDWGDSSSRGRAHRNPTKWAPCWGMHLDCVTWSIWETKRSTQHFFGLKLCLCLTKDSIPLVKIKLFFLQCWLLKNIFIYNIEYEGDIRGRSKERTLIIFLKYWRFTDNPPWWWSTCSSVCKLQCTVIFEFGMKCLINIILILLLLILYSENLVTSCHCFCHKRVSFLFFFLGKLLLGLSEISVDNCLILLLQYILHIWSMSFCS